MKRKTLLIFMIATIVVLCPAAIAQGISSGQSSRPNPTPHSHAASAHQAGQVNLKLDRGGKVTVNSRVGTIIITGWDRDIIEAKAVDDTESVPIEVTGQESRSKIYLSVSRSRRSGGDVRLDVKLPRYADIESINSLRGDIEVSDVDGSVSISSGTGDVRVNNVGSLKVTRRQGDLNIKNVKDSLIARTSSSDVFAENIGGLVDIATTNGNVTVRDAKGDLRAHASTGDIQVFCAKGRADVTSASGSITLLGIGGDVEANTTSGDVVFRGPIRESGRYRLKSLSGDVRMTIQPDAPGFTATLLTYNGELETAFPLRLETPLQGGPINRRIIGRYGDGEARLTLDSFNGSVRIIKGTAASINQCK